MSSAETYSPALGSRIWRWVRQVPRALVGIVAGIVAGLFGSMSHQYVAGADRWPVGLVLALALTTTVAACLRAARARTPTRLAALAGWLFVALQAAGRRREGDVLIPANTRGYVWLLVGFALFAAVLTLPPLRRPHL